MSLVTPLVGYSRNVVTCRSGIALNVEQAQEERHAKYGSDSHGSRDDSQGLPNNSSLQGVAPDADANLWLYGVASVNWIDTVPSVQVDTNNSCEDT